MQLVRPGDRGVCPRGWLKGQPVSFSLGTVAGAGNQRWMWNWCPSLGRFVRVFRWLRTPTLRRTMYIKGIMSF